MAGDYIIRLNYFKGSGPTVAKVIFRTVTKYYFGSFQLNEALGEDGNANPPHKVGIIRVTKDGDVFTFGIAE